MAFFGDLEHHALTDLARVLRSQTGTLFFHEAYQGRTLELTLIQGELRALYVDGFPVQEPARVRAVLRELHSVGRGAFEFQRREFPVPVPAFYAFGLGELLQEFSEAFIPPDQLPHPDTRFVPAGVAASVPPSLAAAWALLQPHLLAGASASDLSRQVGHSEHDVLVMLHRLRAVDLVAPQRAGMPARGGPVPTAETTTSPLPSPPPAPAPLVRRLLGALRRLTGAART